MFLSYAGGFAETVADLADYERAGLDIVRSEERRVGKECA